MMEREEKNRLILAELARLYPDAKPALHFANPFQLLVAVVLSAQCTDVKVNMVTPALFAAYPDAAALAKAEPEEIEPYIKTCGLFHNKAKNLVLMARELVALFGGEVPADHDALESLPGVGRKTANVVMSCAFGEDAIAVDTHVFRVTNRLGLADAPDVLKTEHQLMQAVPKDQWSRAHHWLIYHGRRVCAARKPACETCTLRAWCRLRERESQKQEIMTKARTSRLFSIREVRAFLIHEKLLKNHPRAQNFWVLLIAAEVQAASAAHFLSVSSRPVPPRRGPASRPIRRRAGVARVCGRLDISGTGKRPRTLPETVCPSHPGPLPRCAPQGYARRRKAC